MIQVWRPEIQNAETSAGGGLPVLFWIHVRVFCSVNGVLIFFFFCFFLRAARIRTGKFTGVFKNGDSRDVFFFGRLFI